MQVIQKLKDHEMFKQIGIKNPDLNLTASLEDKFTIL